MRPYCLRADRALGNISLVENRCGTFGSRGHGSQPGTFHRWPCARGLRGTWTTGELVATPNAPRALELASFSQPGLEGADGGRCSSGEDSGEGAGPSTCLISLQSAGDAGDFAFLLFLDLVILEMTGVLVICTTGAVAGASCCCWPMLQAVYSWFLLLSEFFSILLRFGFLPPFLLALAATADAAGARGLIKRMKSTPCPGAAPH